MIFDTENREAVRVTDYSDDDALRGQGDSCLKWAALVVLAACGAAKPGPTSQPTIDTIAGAALREGGAVGLSIVVMHGDQVVHGRGYGLADVDHHVTATERSVYPLASLSKQYWGLGIAQLVESGRLAVDSSIADVLHDFPDRRVSVRHLLTHTSGLGDDAPDEDDVTFRDAPKVMFEPGSWWHYSNRGSILARRIVEQLNGGSWDRYLHDRIATPLGLTSTTTCTFDNHVRLYGKQPLLPASEMTRIAFVCANAIDVARFERSLDTGALVRPETVRQMRTATRIAGFELPYGWFTRIGELGGHRAYGHTGNFPGVSVAAFRFPADDLTIVVLMNSSPKAGFRAYELVTRIARAELGLAEPELHDGKVPHTELEAIAGTYVYGDVRVTVSDRDGSAWITIVEGGKQVYEGALVWAGGRSFAGGPDGVHADELGTFLPPSGKATALAVGHRMLLDNVFRREP